MDYDCLAKITIHSKFTKMSGYRPAHLIRKNYLTTGQHEYIDNDYIGPDETALGFITFI